MGLSYRDAVRLLGGQSGTAKALDRLSGGLLLAASATGSAFVLSLFDARGELARLSGALVTELGDRIRGLDRFQRSERLAAAHAVIVLTAYFEALAGLDLPFDVERIEPSEQVALAGGGPPGANRPADLATGLLKAEVPMPAPQWPYEVTLDALGGFYGGLSEEVVRFFSGLAAWDRLDETQRDRLTGTLVTETPSRAVARYEELFRRLAVEFPEVAFWANAVDHQATRERLRELGGALAGLERTLAGIATGRLPDERRLSLSRAYRAALDRPILTSNDAFPGVRLPSLGMAYVNPDFRIAVVDRPEGVGEESWWEEQPVREDLEAFLLGRLTVPEATRAPLMVLGQPGSGKSVLTRILAARLPPSEFLTVRVELREVPADADLQAQIEHAVRAATGETLSWPELARSRGDALPVVLLDGFDELLQATGVSQTDYLQKVADFQSREADQGRPVAVWVTSRTAVADRARPIAGMVAVRLEPFRERQVGAWLRAWNETNETNPGWRPLTSEAVLAQGELARQPLLLLMLALYDAGRNRLRGSDASIGQGELYERLLHDFAEREVRKAGAALARPDFQRAVERELTHLSLVAFAMFNRGRQWITEAELDADLAALAAEVDRPMAPAGLRSRLTAAQIVLGRFFFVHEAQATRDDRRLATYEFLHATFGEFLVARCVVNEIAELAELMSRTRERGRHVPIDDAYLHAVLSFMPLTMRNTTVSFVEERLRDITEEQRVLFRDLFLELFHDALVPRRDTRHADYAPQPAAVPRGPAVYSANLVLLLLLTGGELTVDELFPNASDPVAEWRRIALLWRSQLPPEGWLAFVEFLDLDRRWEGDRRRLRISGRSNGGLSPTDPFWTYDIAPGTNQYFAWARTDAGLLRRQAQVLCDDGDDVLVHALEPLAEELGSTVVTFHVRGGKPPLSAAQALIRLWLELGRDEGPEELTEAFEACLQIALYGFAPADRHTRRRFRRLFLRHLAEQWLRLDSGWLDHAMRLIGGSGGDPVEERDELRRDAMKILAEDLLGRAG
ncbi:NACHT domain-containing protein [Actinoallomurus iriomotensis]|uniref:AAA+ ATPase domain-containing protein n=1 Tax=Actinoallomurus iriomotensis TaxID=478107 RepID=A0A9W6SF72_9ACTN|nr:ATP-binding protein [Actinoallomurus iriomotensis]GLY92458.1 hypothetical protein Airi02_103860 [Actinoallomurus iriomotensis]